MARGYTIDDEWDLGVMMWEIEGKDWPKVDERCEDYYVLHVEWEGGFAYRKGIGRVMRDFWEARERD
jgi:hypothetical protein